MKRLNAVGALILALCALPSLVSAQVTVLSQAAPSINISGAVTTGGTFQTFAGVGANRKSLDFVNICNVAAKCTALTNKCYLYLSTGVATTDKAIPVAAGVEYLRATGIIPSDSIQITCDGNGDKFYLAVQ